MTCTRSGWLRRKTTETPARRATAALVMARCSSFRSAKASNAAWRFFSDLACALILHCSVRVRFAIVDAPIPKSLLFDGLDDLFSVDQLLLVLLPCPCVGWISSQCFHRNQ